MKTMKTIKRFSLITAGLLLLTGLFQIQAQELRFIMCGGEVRAADQQVIDAFKASNPGVTVNMEAVPWGTCQDKSMTLAAAGDPVSLSYMGSRTLKQLGENNLIVPVTIPEKDQANYQPGILNTVSHLGKFWGFPHAFSTKALFINCGLIEKAGMQCVAPHTWEGMYQMAKTVKDKLGIAGVGLVAKDFDNTMHQFLNYLYSNGGTVIDPATNNITLNSPQAIEALEFYGKLASVAQEGPTAFERSQVKDLFNDEKVAMYIDGPWGGGQHKKTLKTINVPIPAGPSGNNGTLLITDSIAVFKGTGHESVAMELARALSSGQAQYELDSSWGLTPIMKYEKFIDNPYYVNNSYWSVFVEPIASGGPEPLFVEYKSLQTVMNNMIQGIVLGEGSAADLVATAAEELEEFK
ncbi:MAG: putative ABC transporter-binding protein [Deltaproteobacteria bacterium]|jgi:multiple sugar transport system substrate-binding protein|nr:putative ABC transporter-binding protein [Deltaproteobacteria bacterium]